jgi:hypothetical protein
MSANRLTMPKATMKARPERLSKVWEVMYSHSLSWPAGVRATQVKRVLYHPDETPAFNFQ